MKKYTKQQLAKGYLALHQRSPKRAVAALAAALVSQRATRDVDLVIREIGRLLLARGQAYVKVRSARPVGEKHQRSLVQTIKRLTGATHVYAHYTFDPKLHGGFIAETATSEIDGSVAGILKTL